VKLNKSQLKKLIIEVLEENTKDPINEVVMTQEPLDILDELRSLADKLSLISANTDPLNDVALEMMSQINDLEEILTTEEE
tara:strand:+ start:455 stop:697 length:243 start_codon:yes stop_codon:yes gene_type:complete